MNLQALPLLTVVSITDNKDGSATCEIEYNDDFVKSYLKHTKRKKATQRGVGNWILKLLKESLNEP